MEWRRLHPGESNVSANIEIRSATIGGTRRPHPPKLKRKASGGVYVHQAANRYGAGDGSDSDSDG